MANEPMDKTATSAWVRLAVEYEFALPLEAGDDLDAGERLIVASHVRALESTLAALGARPVPGAPGCVWIQVVAKGEE